MAVNMRTTTARAVSSSKCGATVPASLCSCRSLEQQSARDLHRPAHPARARGADQSCARGADGRRTDPRAAVRPAKAVRVRGFPPEAILGDYVDPAKQSLETICLLLAYKIKYPENFFHPAREPRPLLASIRRYIDGAGRQASGGRQTAVQHKAVEDANIDENILTVHGGLSPSMEQMRRVMWPTDVPDTDAGGISSSRTGTSSSRSGTFHAVLRPNYCGELDDEGAMMGADELLLRSFQGHARRVGQTCCMSVAQYTLL
ncbi:hypothetical protein FB451DRAFT_1198268 [Mycena latifolia]|nr:hypothetical protein FB451DRAFT_1198268 [Mycena latifolia]